MKLLQTGCAVALWLGAAGCCYHAVKPLPPGLAYCGAPLPAASVRFLSDETYLDTSGVRRSEQEIFDTALERIAQAERLVVADLFLFNPFLGSDTRPHRRLCDELADALAARKRAVPGLRAVLITDPVNTVYGGLEAPHLERLRAAGVEVVETRLDRLRDSNTAWSSVWRPLVRPWGNRTAGGWLGNPFGSGEVTLRSWLALLNFKANHRKVLVTDSGGTLYGLVTSANPHDGSSAHTNVGLLFSGPAAQALVETERAVLALSGGGPLPELAAPGVAPGAPASPERLQVLTEGAIADTAEALIGGAGPGDSLDLVMFYLADRALIRALQAAARRGVAARVTLDPNKDAFGRAKDGRPNRQVARELVAAGVPVRWAVTTGEQMHAKLLLLRRRDGTADLLLGSANFTRRNLRDYNLETDVRVAGRREDAALAAAAAFTDRLWMNEGGTRTTAYETFADESRWRTFLYRVQEATGLCTW